MLNINIGTAHNRSAIKKPKVDALDGRFIESSLPGSMNNLKSTSSQKSKVITAAIQLTEIIVLIPKVKDDLPMLPPTIIGNL